MSQGKVSEKKKIFSANLVRYREELGLNPHKLAQKAGVDSSVIYKYESGEHIPAAENLTKLARALGIRSECLLNPSSDAIPAPTRADVAETSPIFGVDPHRARLDAAWAVLSPIDRAMGVSYLEYLVDKARKSNKPL